MTYTGEMVDSLTQMVIRAERCGEVTTDSGLPTVTGEGATPSIRSEIPVLTPITTEVRRIQFCPKCGSPMTETYSYCIGADCLRDQILASMKRGKFFEETDEQGRRRCLECKEFQHIVKGTDHCAECLKKIEEEDQ